MVTTEWRETAQGQALYIETQGLKVAFAKTDLEVDAAGKAAISIWEGVAGHQPRAFIARWRWRRGLRRIGRAIDKAIAEEGEA